MGRFFRVEVVEDLSLFCLSLSCFFRSSRLLWLGKLLPEGVISSYEGGGVSACFLELFSRWRTLLSGLEFNEMLEICSTFWVAILFRVEDKGMFVNSSLV